MEKQRNLEDIKRLIEKKNLNVVSLIRWGLYGVICMCKDEENMKKWEEKKETLKRLFIKVERMEIFKKTQSRFCWIECRGIPLGAWSLATLENIAAKTGKLLALDKEMETIHRIDVAKLFVETDQLRKLDVSTQMDFLGDDYNIVVSEVESDENVAYFLSHESRLGKVFSSQEKCNSEGSQGTHAMSNESMDLGGSNYFKCNEFEVESSNKKIDDKEKAHDQLNYAIGEQELEKDSSAGQQLRSFTEGSSESIRVVEEGTMVLETQPNLTNNACSTPILKSPSTLYHNRSVDRANDCSCCKDFRKSRDLLVEVCRNPGGSREALSLNSDSKVELDSLEDENNNKRQRRVGVSKKKNALSSTKIGLKGILKKQICKDSKVVKGIESKKKKKKKVCRKGKSPMSFNSSESYSTEEFSKRLNEGIEICEQVGVKIRNNSARMSQFADFLLGADANRQKNLSSMH